ncbi:hypothetical protein CKN86_09900 [Carnobacterium divergens]|uniref:hypothetical protein n=1 Tax=Carnobacterium divergens TaxID=2748 RepID=UPI000D3F131E|nr:hypothetical protein [Carnobacterium divergens]MCO6017856.1 hypothetical protein [Carnobacterium divergens]TFI60735.1 hypothetical protein CKN62_10040 [Carnobacterium divergens]TFI87758.1 hypothetical protein CKN84_09930 [Carnobacterium divergens]TFJ02325.1 hypothetical protein CKN86_09900 [Carnobacterium divergens]TFJ03836.1 hypothetical protein CKN65_09940 [Carnobacterium divergens]
MRKTIGILSIMISIIVGLQSLMAGLANTLSDNGETGGSVGILLSFILLTAGVILLASKGAKGMLTFSMIFYLLGGLLGMIGAGSYKDLVIWSVISLLFALLLFFQIRKTA